MLVSKKALRIKNQSTLFSGSTIELILGKLMAQKELIVRETIIYHFN